MIRHALLAALATSVALAEPAPKTAPDKYAKAAGEAFKAAYAADTTNDLLAAQGLYTKAFQISPHPATAYNLADVYRRRGVLTTAIEYYEVYLLLAPDAKDGGAVRALMGKLAATPSVVTMRSTRTEDPQSVDFTSTYILFEGRIAKKVGVPGAFDPQTNEPTLDLPGPAGEFRASVVSEITFGGTACNAPPGSASRCTVVAPPRTDGNLVVDTSSRYVRVVTTKGIDVTQKRVALPAGKQTLIVRQGSHECARIPVDVPGGNAVGYVFVSVATGPLRTCRPITAVQHRLTF